MWLRAIHILFIQFKAVFFFSWQFSSLWLVLPPSLASSMSGFNQPLCVQTESYGQPGNLRMTVSPGPQYSFLELSALAWWVKSSLCALWQTGPGNEKAIWFRVRGKAKADFGFKQWGELCYLVIKSVTSTVNKWCVPLSVLKVSELLVLCRLCCRVQPV